MKTMTVAELMERNERDPAWCDSVLASADAQVDDAESLDRMESYVPVPEEMRCDYVMRCSDDGSPNSGIKEGDYIYIKAQDTVENGELAAVWIAGADDDGGCSKAVLRVVYKGRDYIVLSEYVDATKPPEIFRGDDADRVRVLGKAVAKLSRIR